MAYHLLTGATGLIGRYLLHRLQSAGIPVAVLVRGSKTQTALERLEAIMQHWETQERRSLPRPVVVEGDVTRDDLGLSSADRKWVSHHCEAVVHNAASMTFQPDKHGEPHRTNVGGMRQVLDCCRRLGIRRFHHVSTAYVCGLREGRVREDELDVGQTMGNVYEESKIEAEKMLRDADWLQCVTVFRPASVVGDSQSGYTSSYHGFYLPLHLAYSFGGAVPLEEMNERFIRCLGLSGEERKNFVPVDWVSAGIAHVVAHPEYHGRTYHLAAPAGVSIRLLQSVVQEALRRFCKRPAAAVSSKELDVYEQLFRDQLLIYRSHWRDDPLFDLTNTRQALADLPCPEMDFELLLRVARWPIANNFGKPKHVPWAIPDGARRVFANWLRTGAEPSDSGSVETVDLQVTGAGGGQWRLLSRGGELRGARRGLSGEGRIGVHLNSDTLGALADGRLSVEDALCAGRLVVEGPREAQSRAVGIVERLVESVRSKKLVESNA